ncbi:MAG: hypothetical protein ACRD2J_05465 [Thermoanaerobaculia bacterium]
MTGEAWVMLLVTWAVVTFFMVRFFYRVVKTPVAREEGGVEGAAEVEDISEHD